MRSSLRLRAAGLLSAGGAQDSCAASAD